MYNKYKLPKKDFFFSFLIFIQICFSSILVGAMAAPRYTHGVPNNTDLKKKLYIIIKIFLFVHPSKKLGTVSIKIRNTLKLKLKKKLFVLLSGREKGKSQKKKIELKSEKKEKIVIEPTDLQE